MAKNAERWGAKERLPSGETVTRCGLIAATHVMSRDLSSATKFVFTLDGAPIVHAAGHLVTIHLAPHPKLEDAKMPVVEVTTKGALAFLAALLEIPELENMFPLLRRVEVWCKNIKEFRAFFRIVMVKPPRRPQPHVHTHIGLPDRSPRPPPRKPLLPFEAPKD